METFILDKDIQVFYITASSFPNGVLQAHESLHKLVPFTTTRRYFGLSRPENGGAIIYKAAAEEMTPGEGAQLNCETMRIKKGNYICLSIAHFMKDASAIEKAFNMLTAQPGIDPEGYCVEWYLDDAEESVRCMVRLADKK